MNIVLITGSMYAGKSTELIRRLSIYSSMGIKTLYINSSLDTRGEKFSTHNKTLNSSLGEIDTMKTLKLLDLLNPIFNLMNYQVVGIDEGQFFPDLLEFVRALELICFRLTPEEKQNFTINIIISGLNGDYNRKPFGDIINIVPLCDEIVLLKPFCKICSNNLIPAPFTKKIEGDLTEQIDVGGIDKYIPVCRKHYFDL